MEAKTPFNYQRPFRTVDNKYHCKLLSDQATVTEDGVRMPLVVQLTSLKDPLEPAAIYTYRADGAFHGKRENNDFVSGLDLVNITELRPWTYQEFMDSGLAFDGIFRPKGCQRGFSTLLEVYGVSDQDMRGVFLEGGNIFTHSFKRLAEIYEYTTKELKGVWLPCGVQD